MRNFFVIFAFIICGFGADAATPQPRGRAQTNASSQTANTKTSTTGNTSQTARAARSATVQRAQRTPVNNTAQTNQTNSPAPGVKTRSSTSTSLGRSATTGTAAARSAKQSVISTGTKVTAATQNTVVDEKCWNGFMGCMDSFCMLDNANGGRCICSDKNAEYDSILAEIQSLDEQSYQMATVGVERIEMGDDANAVMKKTQEITKSIENDSAQKRKTLDLSAWNVNELDFDADVEDIFSLSSDGTSITNKTGDALYRAAAKLCNAQIPECKSQSSMMELMYKQRVRSDCTAYENSLRQQRTQSAQKLASAQGAMREAALEQYRNANKYDLGQCTVQFKQCMQTTGGCGDDFSGCVEYSVRENLVKSLNDTKPKTKTIKGTSSKIQLTAETYDVLESKKELCMSVTQQCVNVRDQVWDTFLREVAPQVKSAELMAESNVRTSCISNIASCFQKACKDNMDPNDPEGSYDMCLTNPENMRNACKVEIDPCQGAIPNIMTYVTARLSSMRVDSCTREFKECLQSEDRCGSDYTQCIGLSTDTIIGLCPADKLVGCKYETERNTTADVYQNLAAIAQGIFLNIDNNMLETCQKAVQNKVLEVCGSLSECEAFADDTVMGTDSLAYNKQSSKVIIDGLMNFGLLTFNDDLEDPGFDRGDYAFPTSNNNQPKPNPKPIQGSKGQGHSSKGQGHNQSINPDEVEEATKQRITAAINTVENSAKQKVQMLSSDPTIDMCINGRTNSWRYSNNRQHAANDIDNYQRFPHLLDSYTRMIFNSALHQAYLNYSAKYNEYVTKAFEDQSDDVKTALCAAIAHQENQAYCAKYAENTQDGKQKCEKWEHTGEISLDDMFANGSDDSEITKGGTRYEINVANLKGKTKVGTEGKGDWVQIDKEGNMIGMISVLSTYAPGTNICTVRTESKFCKDMEMKITTNHYDCTAAGVGATCGNGEGGGWSGPLGASVTTVSEETYHGTYCNEYGEPDVNIEEIKM